MTVALKHSPRLLDRVRVASRAKHYSHRTEAAYVQWIRRFILFHSKRQASEMSEPEVRAFVNDLAVRRRVAASKQNQALAAALLHWDVLGHRDVRTTMIYTHVLRRGAMGVRSPLDADARLRS